MINTECSGSACGRCADGAEIPLGHGISGPSTFWHPLQSRDLGLGSRSQLLAQATTLPGLEQPHARFVFSHTSEHLQHILHLMLRGHG